MKEKSKMIRRLLAGLLSLVMMFTMVPVTSVETEAATTSTDTYISMPITIRDYAADGMLFEFNQVGATGVAGAVSTSYTIYAINGSNKNVTNGIHVYTYGNYGWEYSSVWNLCIICDSSGNIVKVIPSGTSKGDVTANTGVYYNTMKSGYYSVWVNATVDGYSTLSSISDSNKGDYTLTYSGTTLTLKAAGSGVYNQGDTAGFSLLSTTANDYINNMQASGSPSKTKPDPVIDTNLGIENTKLINNGYWGLTSDPDAVITTLNSGATQEVYGAWIRTDLVQPNLVNGKMVYTEAAVNYLANYMSQIMQVPWQNSDGSYNTYFVMGDELDELGGKDLATKIRAQLATDELGTYADAKAKFDEGNLNDYTQITTYYDAAYFLLHNVFNDNKGYGKTVNNYKNLNLVQTTNSDGETCYVFNSGYDDAVYDYTNGVIYNTQTNTITVAETKDGTASYVRGNALPAARFDPLGMSGAGADLGYGMSGDTYGDLVSDSTADWADYYDNTNYNLSLEGHAQFIYYEDDNLYFTFTGDDDVYLFINGTRVLDVGAAHSISKVSINLNDVATLCGLKDGQSYDFDFFYMERHGTAANFGIETNIKIVDPAMTTTKTGYQNGVNTGYNGYVDPLVPVVYEFGLKNNGEAAIQELTFTDGDIGVELTKDAITLNDETAIGDLTATVYNEDGSVKNTYSSLTEDTLKSLLAAGLDVGEQIVIYGFKYTIPKSKWTSGNGTFPNTVYTTAISTGDNNSQQTLNGIADWKVQQREYSFKDYHVYEWVGKGVTLTKDELLKPIADVVAGFDATKATIAVSSASGATSGTNVNTKAVLNSDGSITYTGTATGADTFYYKVTEDSVTAVIGVAVYSYDMVDNTYVLDYGLSIDLSGENFGYAVNDTLVLSDNPNKTNKILTKGEETNNYGVFTWNEGLLAYTPNDIIDDIDTIKIHGTVLEENATSLTKFTGVEMYETITTAPASVVYYEENFPGITYVTTDNNNWVQYETVDEDGNSVAGTEQSADQDSNYGSDPNYLEDKAGEWATDEVEDEVVLEGDASNGTIKELVVKETAEVMHFDFKGTGFEIVSRTTDEQYAVINVLVYKVNDDESYTLVTQKPVITESKGGDLYQVPIISITGLDYDNYYVVVKAAGSSTSTTRVFYIDGIRIYGPLSSSDAGKYYNSDEVSAEIFEIKQLIDDGKLIYADAYEYSEDIDFNMVTGVTVIENQDASSVLVEADDVDAYMNLGPNNEIYLDGISYAGMIAFYLTPIEGVEESARTIEIGAHRKVDSGTEDTGYATMVYGSTADEIIEESNLCEVSSGTEQYYTIDVNKLTLGNDGRYLVMIGTNVGENLSETLALTNLKISGYTIENIENDIQTASDEGGLDDLEVVKETTQVFSLRRAITEEDVEEEIVEVTTNENLIINSAVLRASTVVSGKLASLTVKATTEAASIIITDADGNEVELSKQQIKTAADVATITAMWVVSGNSGDVFDYTITVYDANGLSSVNTETVTVTIK